MQRDSKETNRLLVKVENRQVRQEETSKKRRANLVWRLRITFRATRIEEDKREVMP